MAIHIDVELHSVADSPRFAADHSREAYTWAGVSRNISCFPLAEPPASVEWTRFGQIIVNNGTYEIFSTTTASNLQVLLNFCFHSQKSNAFFDFLMSQL